jgi:HD-like signal output (HDOD) protein
MHDIGKLLLLQRSGEEYSRVIKMVEEKGCDFALAEEEVYPFSHAEAGQLIGQKWNFSDELIEIIRCHHYSWEKLAEAAQSVTLTKIVKAADTIAHALGLGHSRGFNRLRNRALEELPEVWEHLRVPASDQKELLTAFERAYNHEYDLYVSKTSRAE